MSPCSGRPRSASPQGPSGWMASFHAIGQGVTGPGGSWEGRLSLGIARLRPAIPCATLYLKWSMPNRTREFAAGPVCCTRTNMNTRKRRAWCGPSSPMCSHIARVDPESASGTKKRARAKKGTRCHPALPVVARPAWNLSERVRATCTEPSTFEVPVPRMSPEVTILRTRGQTQS